MKKNNQTKRISWRKSSEVDSMAKKFSVPPAIVLKIMIEQGTNNRLTNSKKKIELALKEWKYS